jgi:hypothetical protein
MGSSDGAELIHRGIECGRHNQLERGILFLVEGLEKFDERENPRLALSGHHNLALFFGHLGLPLVARGVLIRARRLYLEVGDPVMEARRVWLQGTLGRISGNNRLAAKKFRRAVEMFRELGQLDQAAQIQEDLQEVLDTQAILDEAIPP